MKQLSLLLIFFLFGVSLLFSQSSSASLQSKKLYSQLYAIKYTILGLSASAEFLLDKKRLTLNIEPSISLFPILSSLSKSVSGLDILFANTANAKIMVEPKYYFLNKEKRTGNNSFNSISLAATYHFRENNISKADTSYCGLSIIPKFSFNSNISGRIYFQGGIGCGLAFRTSNHGEHLVKGILGLDIKFAFAFFRR